MNECPSADASLETRPKLSEMTVDQLIDRALAWARSLLEKRSGRSFSVAIDRVSRSGPLILDAIEGLRGRFEGDVRQALAGVLQYIVPGDASGDSPAVDPVPGNGSRGDLLRLPGPCAWTGRTR